VFIANFSLARSKLTSCAQSDHFLFCHFSRLKVYIHFPYQKNYFARFMSGILAIMPSIFGRSKYGLRAIVLAVTLCAIAGCGGPARAIAGKWRMSDSNETIWEFAKNGSVVMGSTQGRYTFGGGNRIKIETPFATSLYQMEFSGDRMILRAPQGSKLEFTRIR
jgi:hypothetical protein